MRLCTPENHEIEGGLRAGRRLQRLLVTTALFASFAMGGAYAQDRQTDEKKPGEQAQQAETTNQEDADAVQDTVHVEGIRATIQTSIEDKRNATTITDVISSDQIGNLPALSIGEVLETIPGAGANRSRVGATEFALRGLGPFFGATSFNGREASNGSGDRSVNFSQFPSELINTVRVYKSQQANQIEGGISGVVELETIRPLDARRRTIQLEAKAAYSSLQDGLEDSDPGWRGTFSYIDQFDGADFGKFGVSFGAQMNDISNPVDTYGTSSTVIACNATVSAAVCPQVNGLQVEAGTPFYLTPTSRIFRQTETDDTRNSVFGAAQWQPNNRWEVNADFEWSQAKYYEIRHDLGLPEAYAFQTNQVMDSNGVLLSYDGVSSVDSSSGIKDRQETYKGGGINIAWQATDKLEVSGDLSYSNTHRDDLDNAVRLRTDPFDIYGNVTPYANQRIAYSFQNAGDDVPIIVFDPLFDVTNHDLFSDDLGISHRDINIENEILAARFDGDYALDKGIFSGLKAGIRYSELTYTQERDDTTYTQSDRTIDQQVNLACRTNFPQSNFLGSSDSNTISTWAIFDPVCQIEQYLGTQNIGDGDYRDTSNVDVTEDTFAAYVMAEFDTQLGKLPVSGNFGVRFVDTEVSSVGLRSGFTVVDNGDGTIRLEETGGFDSQTFTHSYSEVLPSVNVTLFLKDNLYLRGAVYRAMVRADPSDLSAGRSVQVEAGNFTNAGDAISEVIANGNPSLEPLMAWNFDTSLEYYPNPDSLFALAFYYKVFEGNTIPVIVNETFNVDGVDFTVPVTVSQSTDDTSEIYGLEATAQYRFSQLPYPFDGLSARVSYNYTTTDYETQDIRLGEMLNPSTGEVIPAIVPPVSLDGQSDHIVSASLVYTLGGLEVQGIYKYRSEYFQKFVGGGRQNRLVRDAGVFDLRASYALNPNLLFTFEALNVNDEPRLSDIPIPGSMQGYEAFGSSYFLGVRLRY